MTLPWQRLRYGALWLWHQFITFGLVALVVLALWVGLGRQLAPLAADYRAGMEARLSAAAGLPVGLAQLRGRWEGLGPVFELRGLALHDPAAPRAAPLLQIPLVELRPALWQSLRGIEPRLDVRVSGLAIRLDQLPDGRLQVRELASLGARDPAALRRVLDLALRQPQLAVSDSRLTLALTGRPVLVLSRLALINRNRGDRHLLGGEFLLADPAQRVQFHLDFSGDPVDWRQGRLAAWLHLPVRRLDDWLPRGEAAGFGLASATAGGEFWLQFEDGRLSGLQARPVMPQGRLQSPRGEHVLRDWRGVLDWRRDAAGWRLGLQGVQGRLDDAALTLPALGLRRQERTLLLAGNHIDIGQWQPLLSGPALPPALVAWWQDAQPAGRLRRFALHAGVAEDGRWQPQQLTLEADALKAAATARWPGGEGIAGWLQWTPGQSWVGLALHQARLDLRQTFREPVAVGLLSGVFAVRHDAAGWQVRSGLVRAQNDDARGQAVLQLDVPAAAPARLALRARLRDGRASSAWRYVPWPAAGDNTLAWLRRAVVAGEVVQGDFLFAGPLTPQADGERLRQQMQFVLRDAALDYQPGWPALRALEATVRIDGRMLAVEGRQALLYDATRATGLAAVIPDLAQPRLAVSAEVASNGTDLMRLFADSPLSRHTAGVAAALALEGAVHGRLALDIPLSPRLAGQAEVSARAQFADNRLLLRQPGLVAGALNGELAYDSQSGLRAEALSAELLAAPVRASVRSEMRRGQLSVVTVEVAGHAGVPALREWLGDSPLWAAAEGGSDYRAQVRIPVGAEPRLQLESGLAGLRLRLPAPFGKAAAERLPLRYQSGLGSGEQLARLQLGSRLGAGLVWQDGRLRRGLLRLGSSDAGWPAEGVAGFAVEGRLALLDLADWQPWLERLRTPRAGSLPGLQSLALELDELQAAGWRLAAARLGAEREAAGWRLRLANPELEAELLWPEADGAALQVDIARLRWPLAGMPAEAAAGAGLPPALATRPVQLRLNQLQLAAWLGLGPVAGQARLAPSPWGLRVDGLQFTAASVQFDGRLDWQWRGGASSRLRGTLRSGDVAALLRALAYAPSLHSPSAQAEVDLGWPGAPADFQVAGLRGEFMLRVEDGRLLNINTTTSASRVFGLIDLENIRRRLKGDFSDVLQKGLSFDSASLRGEVSDGVMPAAVFQLAGPSLQAAGQGSLDLARQTLDQQFVVSMPVSSAVPLAAVVVGGPLVGGAVAAAEAAFKKQIEKATLLRYHVSGSWADPVVERHNRKLPGLDGLLVKGPAPREEP